MRTSARLALAAVIGPSLLISGCVTPLPTADEPSDQYAKTFPAPPGGWAGLYLVRGPNIAPLSKRNLYVDGQLVGTTLNTTYYYRLVLPGTHEVATDSEWSPNTLSVECKEGDNSFVEQYMRPGLFSAGADLRLKTPEEGQALVKKSSLNYTQDSAEGFNVMEWKETHGGKGSIAGPNNAVEAEAMAIKDQTAR